MMFAKADSVDLNDLVSVESERGVTALFEQRKLPRSYHWLYKRSDDFARAHMPTVIDSLCDQGKIAANGDGTWTRQDVISVSGSEVASETSARPPVAVAWEEALFEALKQKGVRVVAKREECGYVLALALTAFAAKLDVEIDGRQHQMLASQKAQDIARDQRLKANGWSVLRLRVADVVADLNGSRDKVLSAWNKLKNGGMVE